MIKEKTRKNPERDTFNAGITVFWLLHLCEFIFNFFKKTLRQETKCSYERCCSTTPTHRLLSSTASVFAYRRKSLVGSNAQINFNILFVILLVVVQGLVFAGVLNTFNTTSNESGITGNVIGSELLLSNDTSAAEDPSAVLFDSSYNISGDNSTGAASENQTGENETLNETLPGSEANKTLDEAVHISIQMPDRINRGEAALLKAKITNVRSSIRVRWVLPEGFSSSALEKRCSADCVSEITVQSGYSMGLGELNVGVVVFGDK